MVTYIAPVEIRRVPKGAGWVLKISNTHRTRFFTPIYEVSDDPTEDFPYEVFFDRMIVFAEEEIRKLCGNLFTVGFEHDWKLTSGRRATVSGSYLVLDCVLRVNTCLAIDWRNDTMVKIARKIRGWEYRLQLTKYSGKPPKLKEDP